MLKRFFIAALLIFYLLSGTLWASSLEIYTPKDKLLTFNKTLPLEGQALGLNQVTVNRVPIEISPSGSFKCSLHLLPGKNLALVEGWSGNVVQAKKTLRILRLISFPDVEKHWARHEIITLATLGVIEGFPDGNFYPERSLSRGELATWLCKAQDLKVSPPTTDLFYDVPKEHWRAPYVKTVVEKGYLKPFSKELFGLEDGMTRGAVANVIAHAEKLKARELESAFMDVPKSHPYYKEIEAIKKQRLIKGVSKKAFIYDPNRNITRAETVMLLSRFKRLKWLDKWLFNFKEGYTSKRYCKVNTPPKILSAQVAPQTLSLGKENKLIFEVQVYDFEGLQDIQSVKIDLTEIGGPPDQDLYDSGRLGDKKEQDGTYTLLYTFEPQDWGEKTFRIYVTDRSGAQDSTGLGVVIVK